MPKVSVVIPAYNVAAFIEDAINSVLGQTYHDFEVVVVDDGSPDETASIVKRFDDPRIRLVSQSNRGLSGARNTGIRYAQGEYVAFLDADDLWRPEKLEEHVRHLDNNPEIGVSYSTSQFIDEDGALLNLFQKPKLAGIDGADLLLRNPVGNGSAPVIRMAALEDIEYADTRYGQLEPHYFDPDFKQSEDIECWVRIATTTKWRFEGIGLPLTLYRINPDGLSASVVRQQASWEAFVEKARGYAPALIAEWGTLARAYQCRYLARRAVWSREPALARQLLKQAFEADRRLLFFEPARTVATTVAVTLQSLLPTPFYGRVEKAALVAWAFASN